MPILGYYLGTLLVCAVCVIIGRFTLRLSGSINERFLSKDHRDMVHMHKYFNMIAYIRLKSRSDPINYFIC